MPSSWVNTECSIHRVQHTSKIVCRPFMLTILRWGLNVGSASDVPPYRSTATSQFSISAFKGKVTLPHSDTCELTNWWIESQRAVNRSPPSTRPISLDHGLQVYLQTYSTTASKCISRLARLRPASWHNHGLQVHISKLARLRPPSVSPNSVDYGMHKCISKLTWSRSRSASLSSLDQGLQVYLQIHSITASKCISKVARSWPRSMSLEFTRSWFSGAHRIALKHCL